MTGQLNAMTAPAELTRRGFLKTSAVAGGLMVAFHIPLAGRAAAQGMAPEINAWVVIRPDDQVVIRICPLGNGPGHPHRAGATRGRGT